MSNVFASTHPLVAHKLSRLRDKNTDPKKFRAFLDGTKEKDDGSLDRAAFVEAALKKAYGLDFAAADAKWRIFVQAGFKSP